MTTMKLSVETRDRLRALAMQGETLEDVVVSALEVLEREAFWAAVAEADASETEQERAARLALDEELDRMMDQLG